jgi:hypothetical protein
MLNTRLPHRSVAGKCSDVLLLIACHSSAAVHQDGGREWPRTVGNVSIESQTNSGGLGVRNIVEVGGNYQNAVCQQRQHARENVRKNFHRNVPGSLNDRLQESLSRVNKIMKKEITGGGWACRIDRRVCKY